MAQQYSSKLITGELTTLIGIENQRWTPLAGQFKDDFSAFLHYCGDTESEKEKKIAQA